MAGDDLILDLVVRGLRENATGDELVLGGVGAAIDDALGVGVADAGKGLELVSRGSVDIERRCSCCRRSRCWFGCLGKSESGGYGEKEGNGKIGRAHV